MAGVDARAVATRDAEQSRQAGSEATGTDRNQNAGRQPQSAGASRSAEPTTSTESTSETSGGRSREAFEAEIEQYEDRIEDLEADLSEREREVLMALYSGVSHFEIPNFVDMDVEKVEEVYDRLIELDILEEVRVRKEVQLKARGRNIASSAMDER